MASWAFACTAVRVLKQRKNRSLPRATAGNDGHNTRRVMNNPSRDISAVPSHSSSTLALLRRSSSRQEVTGSGDRILEMTPW